jgi:hypothetical protein
VVKVDDIKTGRDYVNLRQNLQGTSWDGFRQV